jgi:hypothetical protein
MILDSFQLNTAIVQLQYANAFELWDRAGHVARRLSKIWPGLKLIDAQPQQQTLSGLGVQIQTGLAQSTITLKGEKSLDQHRIQQIKETFDVWRDALDLEEINRVSTRAIHVKKFVTMKDASAYLLALNLVKWPSEKVFDQPQASPLNRPEIAYRFEDKDSFSFLHFKTEELKLEVDLDPEFFDEHKLSELRYRTIIDFDRGVLGTVNAQKFRMDDWLKGYLHVLRRDIQKITGARP